MATASASSSRTRTRPSGPVLRSLSPSGRFYTGSSNASIQSTASAFASSTSSSFSSPSSAFFNKHQDNHSHYNHQDYHHHRAASPTRVNLYTSSALSPAVRFSIEHRSISPNRSITVSKKNGPIAASRKTCMCSPTTHPGSFRCSLHKNQGSSNQHHNHTPYPNNRLNMRRSAMTNSLVRISGVEGEWVKRALTALIRPSSHQQRRRAGFQPRQSRLSVMSKPIAE